MLAHHRHSVSGFQRCRKAANNMFERKEKLSRNTSRRMNGPTELISLMQGNLLQIQEEGENKTVVHQKQATGQIQRVGSQGVPPELSTAITDARRQWCSVFQNSKELSPTKNPEPNECENGIKYFQTAEILLKKKNQPLRSLPGS